MIVAAAYNILAYKTKSKLILQLQFYLQPISSSSSSDIIYIA